jgi:hypothetical protein
MTNANLSPSAKEYEVAAAHYSQRDLRMAPRLYAKRIASNASTREAGYSRTQVDNTVHTVVPEEELLDAETELALARLEAGVASDTEPIRVTRPAPELAE